MDQHPPVTQIRKPDPIHYAWVVLGAVMLVMIAASGLRSVFGVFIKPLEADFHWDRAALSGAAALSLFLLGAVGPFVGRLADRWGPRRVLAVALLVLGTGPSSPASSRASGTSTSPRAF